MGRSWLVGVGLVLLVGVILPGRGTAHAVVLRPSPPGWQTLDRAPEQVQLLFSEPIDVAFSSLRVVDGAGRTVDRGDTHVALSNDHELVVSLNPGLANGVYSVYWRSLSKIDVHPVHGQYALYVGVPGPTGAVATNTAQVTATPETTLGRWWFYLAASLFGGVLAAWRFVLGPILIGPRAHARAAVGRGAYRL